MSFANIIDKYQDFDFKKSFEMISKYDVERVLSNDSLKEDDLLVLLSPSAAPYLEKMAQKAHKLTGGHIHNCRLLIRKGQVDI